MYFINQDKKKFVNSVNQLTPNPITLEYAIEDVYLQFKILNKNSQKVAIANSDEFYLAVSTDYLPKRVCVYSNEYTIQSNSVIFKVNTNTSEYVQDIKQHNSTVNIEIGRKQAADESYHIILQDKILANKRVYVVGQPNPVDADKFYTEDETNEIISNAVTALKQYVIQVVNSNSGLKYEVVSTLPDVSNAKQNTIYLIPENSNSGVDLHQLLMQGGGALPQFSGINGTNIFDEYLLVNHRWECIGNTKVDLTGFVKVNSNSKIDNSLLNLNGYIFSNSKAQIRESLNNSLVFDVKSNSFIVSAKHTVDGDSDYYEYKVNNQGMDYHFYSFQNYDFPIITINQNSLNFRPGNDFVFGVNSEDYTFNIGGTGDVGTSKAQISGTANNEHTANISLDVERTSGGDPEADTHIKLQSDVKINVNHSDWDDEYGAEYKFTSEGLELPFLVAPRANGYDESYRIALRTFAPNDEEDDPANRWGGISFVLQKLPADGNKWVNWGIIFNLECNGEGNVNFARPQGNGNDVTNNSLGEIWDPDGWQQGGDDPGDQGEECPNCHQHSVHFGGDVNECQNCGWSEWWTECPDCGTWFNGDDNSGVCPNCGWSENGGDQGDDQGDNCPECAAPLDGAHHCDFCGWNENGEAGICPDCGSQLSDDENGSYCEMCDWRAPQGE